MERYVITINRLCGCGGMQIASILSKRLGIPSYDKSLLRMASDESGIREDLFHKNDEKIKNSLLFRISRKVYSGDLIAPQSSDFTSDHNIFNYQAKVIRELAENESCIIIGRCADYILRDMPNVVRVFFTADMETCVAREAERYGMTKEEAREKCERQNRERANYYHYYTDQTWSHAGNYDLAVNSSHLSYEDCAEMIIQYMNHRFGKTFG